MKKRSEAIYWQKFLDGDNNAFAYLYEETVSDLHAYGMSLGFDNDTCRDALQDVFYTLYTRKNEIRGVGNIRFYLYRSLKNRLLDIYKKQKNTRQLEDANFDTPPFLIEVSVSEQLENQEEQMLLKQRVEKLLLVLTDRQREAVYLRFMKELEYSEIGIILNMNPESVRKLIFRAMESIRKMHQTIGAFVLFLSNMLFYKISIKLFFL